MILGFTTMNIPRLSDTKSNKDLENLKNQLKFQEEVFAPNVDEVTVLMAKVPVYKEQGENIEILHQDIAAKLSTTKNQVEGDESWESKLYMNVIKTYSDLQVAYKELLSIKEQLADCQSSSSGAGDQVTRLMAEKTQLQGELDRLKAAGAGGGGGGGNTAELEKKLKDTEQKLRDCNLETTALRREIEKLKK